MRVKQHRVKFPYTFPCARFPCARFHSGCDGQVLTPIPNACRSKLFYDSTPKLPLPKLLDPFSPRQGEYAVFLDMVW